MIQPVILCGGSGTRLWPLSTSKIPKQLIKMSNGCSLLEETIKRLNCVKKTHNEIICDPILIMNKDHKLPLNLEQYSSNVIYESYANDTGVAVARVALEIKNKYNNENVTILVLPADHYIENVDAFVFDIQNGLNKVTENNIVLFGIEPTSPASKYGYIIPSLVDGYWFKEKPNEMEALELIKRRAMWNSGIFAGKVDDILKYLGKSTYNIMEWVTNPREGKTASFDVSVLQLHKNIYAHYCLNWRWCDVGTWETFMNIPEIEEEIRTKNNVIMSQCSNVNVLNRCKGNIVIIGCSDLIVVSTDNDILIMPRSGNYDNTLKEIANGINY